MYRGIGAVAEVASDFLRISSRISLEETKPRLILDLRPLNALIASPHFRYDCLVRLFRTGLEKGDLLITVDFAQGYVHLGIGPETLCYCGGTWMGVPLTWLTCRLAYRWHASASNASPSVSQLCLLGWECTASATSTICAFAPSACQRH